MENIKKIKIFISCPSDIREELESIKLIVEETNKISGSQNGYVIAILNWKADTYSQIGADVQDVINDQIDSQYDILIGLLWQRIGTPTLRDKSGTIEEINRALKKGKDILIYFRTSTPDNLNQINLEEIAKVYSFKKELGEQGVLYKEFNSVQEFESMLRMNLTKLISDRLITNANPIKNREQVNPESSKYTEIEHILTEAEKRKTDSGNEIHIFELVEKILSSLSIITSSFESMTLSANNLTDNLNKRTNEIKKLSHIKDNRLRIEKIDIVVNLLATELDEFNNKIGAELPSFSESLLYVGPNYAKLMALATSFDIQEVKQLQSSLREFRDSTEYATRNSANLLKTIIAWPSLTSRFNNSKRETISVLKNLTKEMLQGLRLMDEALKS